jgi:hypothetical protein
VVFDMGGAEVLGVVVMVLTIAAVVFFLTCCVWMCLSSRRTERIYGAPVATAQIANPVNQRRTSSGSHISSSLSGV